MRAHFHLSLYLHYSLSVSRWYIYSYIDIIIRRLTFAFEIGDKYIVTYHLISGIFPCIAFCQLVKITFIILVGYYRVIKFVFIYRCIIKDRKLPVFLV